LNQNKANTLLFGLDNESGYPIRKILQAIAYLISPSTGLKGKRPKGKFLDIITSHLSDNQNASITCLIPDRLTPLVLFRNGRGALIGPQNPKVYTKLVQCDRHNPYKLKIRPLSISDLDEK